MTKIGSRLLIEKVKEIKETLIFLMLWATEFAENSDIKVFLKPSFLYANHLDRDKVFRDIESFIKDVLEKNLANVEDLEAEMEIYPQPSQLMLTMVVIQFITEQPFFAFSAKAIFAYLWKTKYKPKIK